ncbi:hypothetical protein X474_10265 [Dethiosulfatarculus sandiegensis]|uniref:Uncharacterized protein n=1 Tax=Dethiosulfatarculus sandiegensis TaxID=1429043 RepID=A0A0D2J8H1_9BACT|nr:hypothetical protein X474_10265 [Dethiosulfatarculus sandiegensis]
MKQPRTEHIQAEVFNLHSFWAKKPTDFPQEKTAPTPAVRVDSLRVHHQACLAFKPQIPYFALKGVIPLEIKTKPVN